MDDWSVHMRAPDVDDTMCLVMNSWHGWRRVSGAIFMRREDQINFPLLCYLCPLLWVSELYKQVRVYVRRSVSSQRNSWIVHAPWWHPRMGLSENPQWKIVWSVQNLLTKTDGSAVWACRQYLRISSDADRSIKGILKMKCTRQHRVEQLVSS